MNIGVSGPRLHKRMSCSLPIEQEFNQYACDAIEEYYPLLKKAITPRAAAKMKKSMLQQVEQGPDGRMTLENNKKVFHITAKLYCAASISVHVHFNNKALRSTLSKEVLLEKCRICKIDEQVTYQILQTAGFEYPKPMDMLVRELNYTKDYAARLEKNLEWKRSRSHLHLNDQKRADSIRFDERDLEQHRERIRRLEAKLASRKECFLR